MKWKMYCKIIDITKIVKLMSNIFNGKMRKLMPNI